MERKDFPKRLLMVKPPIKELWGEGDLGLLSEANKYLAIVGSRRMTDYGRRVLETFMPDLVQAGVIIVSGMMYGVDQEAHRLCLKFGGKTIAVLGWGIKWAGLAPEDKKMLAQIINSGGLVISEWERRKPELWTFPARNRIVAGLADKILVVEAAIKSGSLVTVSWAEKFGKEVLATPGPITSRVSQGTNYLIASRRAKMVISSEEILCSFGLSHGAGQLSMFQSTERTNNLCSRIVGLLEDEPLTADDLVRRLKEPVNRIGEALTELSLGGSIEERGGRWSNVIVGGDACPR